MASIKQKLLRFIYPFIIKLTKGTPKATILHNTGKALPGESFYDQTVTLNNGTTLNLSAFKGKKVLLVNTASNCGYTAQYAELQQLHETLGNQVAIIAFPANDFREQEKGDDDAVAAFCQVNYGVTFPIARKGVVTKGTQQQPVYRWLTQSAKNGWNDHAPDWNFGKYLVDETGTLDSYFGPSVSPVQKDVVEAVQNN